MSTSESANESILEDGALVAAPEGLVVLNSRRPARSARAKAAETSDLGEQIGEQLRGLYDDVLSQPVPDRFLELLNRLESDPISPERSKTPGEG
ncbi:MULTISPECIES: NepR family anti-sigma factor [Methylosinus]|uniref:NepR family anti-sigma factor n=1 Tax=Methylosinus TaxID=425 RepID=UPI0003625242|nr:NepR family anti-sigma factor [Methylosinus sp. LW4]